MVDKQFRDNFVFSYLMLLLWEADSSGGLSFSDLSKETEEHAKADCDAFINQNESVINTLTKEECAQLPYCFWLSRNSRAGGFDNLVGASDAFRSLHFSARCFPPLEVVIKNGQIFFN